MTLDDLELYKFEFSGNFADFGRNNTTTAIRMKIDHQRQRCKQLNVLSTVCAVCSLRSFAVDFVMDMYLVGF